MLKNIKLTNGQYAIEKLMQIIQKKLVKKAKITLHKDNPLTKETIGTDLHLLVFIKINRKYGIKITTIGAKIELLKFHPDLSKLSSNRL